MTLCPHTHNQSLHQLHPDQNAARFSSLCCSRWIRGGGYFCCCTVEKVRQRGSGVDRDRHGDLSAFGLLGPLAGTVYLGVFAAFVDGLNALITANLSADRCGRGLRHRFDCRRPVFLLRLRHRAICGATEIFAGLVLAGHRVYSESASTAAWDLRAYGAPLTAGAHLVVRRLDNLHTALSSKAADAKK